jgi:2-succinyl-5-enolpyruvyl-6-hydroxy-3-cyclohexene-1-carboxylate synthase
MTRSDFSFRRPVVILGRLAPPDRDRVLDFALRLNAPVYAEPLSGLREEPSLRSLRIASGERMLGLGDFDGVVRIGGVPTLRFWRDLEESRRSLPVVSYSRSPFAGLSRGSLYPLGDLPAATPRDRDTVFFDRDFELAAAIDRVLDEELDSEQAHFRTLSRDLPERARVFLGNSLPIREWDLFASRQQQRFEYEANRGANGIDGQLSTFFGWCTPGRENVAVVGDLTALYDMNAPWIVPQLERGTTFRIVIINNGGGRIFSRVPSLAKIEPRVRATIIENEHRLRFGAWSEMWNLGAAVEERLPDAQATGRVWQRYDALWA